jgi:transcriptional regulator with XRE-family HTH domain
MNAAMTKLTPEACRAARAALDLSQDALATEAKVGLSTVRDFEAGKRELRGSSMAAIRQALERRGVALAETGVAWGGSAVASQYEGGKSDAILQDVRSKLQYLQRYHKAEANIKLAEQLSDVSDALSPEEAIFNLRRFIAERESRFEALLGELMQDIDQKRK